MVEVEVIAGICGFKTHIRVEDKKGYKASCIIESECPNHKKVAKIIEKETINVMNELFKKGESQVLNACQGNIPHVSCPVPAGILKALEAGTGLALSGDAKITSVSSSNR